MTSTDTNTRAEAGAQPAAIYARISQVRATPRKASAGRSGKRSSESTAAAATGR